MLFGKVCNFSGTCSKFQRAISKSGFHLADRALATAAAHARSRAARNFSGSCADYLNLRMIISEKSATFPDHALWPQQKIKW
jgi:hypothetical protein